MDSSHPSPERAQVLAGEARLVSVTETGGGTRYVYAFPERPPRVNVEHDREKRVFRVAQPDGTTDVFRDEPIRFLVATRNPQTSETMPMLRYGEPEYLYLCREEKEQR